MDQSWPRSSPPLAPSRSYRSAGAVGLGLALRLGGRAGLLEPVLGAEVRPRFGFDQPALGHAAVGGDAQALLNREAALVCALLPAGDDALDHPTTLLAQLPYWHNCMAST